MVGTRIEGAIILERLVSLLILPIITEALVQELVAGALVGVLLVVRSLIGEFVSGSLVGELVGNLADAWESQVLHVTGQPLVTASFLEHFFT